MAYLIQTLASAVAILMLAALAWKFGVARHPRLTESGARTLMADEFPGTGIGRIWLAEDGQAALARAQDRALVLYVLGDGHVARTVPWAALAAGGEKGGRIVLDLADRSAPRAVFRLTGGASWPPALEA